MLQVAADRGQRLKVLERLLAACLASRPKRRAHELFEQRRLAVRGGAEDAQVPSRYPEPGELGRGPDDLEIGLVEQHLAVAARRAVATSAPRRSVLEKSPVASSCRITRSGRNSSRCMRRIARSRSTSA